MRTRHILDIGDLTREECNSILYFACHPELADTQLLATKGVALIFEKPSTRTRSSMEMAVVQLGGHPSYIQGAEVGFDVRESVEDITNAMSGYYEFVCARVFRHSVLETMASCNSVSTINMLSDVAHPLQALADIVTLHQEFGSLQGRKIAYVGDANNVARSLGVITKMFDMEFAIACPEELAFAEADRVAIKQFGGIDCETSDIRKAVTGADAIYTDTWVSMGEEDQQQEKQALLEGYSITPEVMSFAQKDAIILHCLPAHRGQEIAEGMIESVQSRIWQQAKNRMHSARGLFQVLCQD